MVKLTLDNSYVSIAGADASTVRALDKICSYTVAGHYFAPAFKNGFWDGKEHLLKRSPSRGLHAPRGLVEDILRKLKKLQVEYRIEHAIDVRWPKRDFYWNPEVTPRGYQNEAIHAVMNAPVKGCGILKMPIRSGKTKTAAKLIDEIGRPALFIAPSKTLLYQTQKALEECFPRERIGIIGDSVDKPERITVASIQTLARWKDKKDPRWKSVVRMADVAIFDEAHHITGEGSWQSVFSGLDCRFKIGLSATAYLDNESENERGIIWLKACVGPIRYEVTMSRLVDEGFLMRQNVRIIPVTEPKLLKSRNWSANLRSRCILSNGARNGRIASEAKRYADEGRQVAIIARFSEHIDSIMAACEEAGVEARSITGKDSAKARDRIVQGMVDGEYNVIVGSVIGEGVDIPTIEVVINAEGGKDIKNTIQRQRNLTISEGKKEAVFIDFMDNMNKIFKKHSKERLEVYQEEDAFNVVIEKG